MDNIYNILKQKGIRVKLGRIHKDDLTKAANIIVAMAWNRDNWITKVQQLLEGALGEYTKLQCSRLNNAKDYWSNEVKRLLIDVTKLLGAKTKGFSKQKALEEAIKQASSAGHQLTSAINEYILIMREEENIPGKEIKKFREKIKNANFTAEMLLKEMLEEYPINYK